EDGIRDFHVTGVQTCALPISAFVPHGDRRQVRGSIDGKSLAADLAGELPKHMVGWANAALSENTQRTGRCPERQARYAGACSCRAEERRAGKAGSALCSRMAW